MQKKFFFLQKNSCIPEFFLLICMTYKTSLDALYQCMNMYAVNRTDSAFCPGIWHVNLAALVLLKYFKR